MINTRVASIFREVAAILQLQDAPFSARAYRSAARAIETLDADIEEYYRAGTLKSIPHIGKATAENATEIIETGELAYLDELREEVPEGVVELLNIPNLGPKRVERLWKELGVESVAALHDALDQHTVRRLTGFGSKTEANLRHDLALYERSSGRTPLGIVLPIAEAYRAYLEESAGDAIRSISVAGSLRRCAPTIGDVDILVSSAQPELVMERFVAYPHCDRVIAQGPTKSSVLLDEGHQTDLRVVDEDAFGAALQYFTGSKSHNIKLRKRALKRGMKLNEYGLFSNDTKKRLAGRTEPSLYRALELPYIPPELREDRGEIEAGASGTLPPLIGYDSLRGDLHIHTVASDGSATIAQLAATAQRLDYEYIGITDHSQRLTVVNGLDRERLRAQHEVIRALNTTLADANTKTPLRILHGTEVDILEDGSLDFDDDTLAMLDYVIASVHSKFDLSEGAMTERLVRAVEHPAVTVLGHPTGKHYGRRDAYAVDLDAVFTAAARAGTWLEINSFPTRFDLEDRYLPRAKRAGARFIISTDSHAAEHLTYARFGISQARRGWLEPDDIMNTRPLPQFLDALGLD